MLRFLWRLAIGGMLPVFAYLTANVWWIGATTKSLEQNVATWNGAAPPASLQELEERFSPAPGEQEGSTLLASIDRDLTRLDTILQRLTNQSGYDEPRQRPATTATLRLILESQQKTLDTIHRAAVEADYLPVRLRRDGGRVAIDWQAMADRLRRLRQAEETLGANVRLLASDGRRNDALEECLAMWRLARLADREPMRIGNAAAIDCRRAAARATHLVLRSGQLADETRDLLEIELARHHPEKAYRQAMEWETAAALHDHDHWLRETPYGGWPVRGVANSLTLFNIDRFKVQAELATTPFHEQPTRPAPKTNGGRYSKDTWQIDWNQREALAVSIAELRCVRLLNALQARGFDSGLEARSLASFELPEEMTRDPFDGQLLRLKPLPSGLVVYSVGPNLKDDQGEIFDGRQDVGMAPPGSRSLIKALNTARTFGAP